VATIIDALVVTLGFDTKGVGKGASDGKKALKDLKENSEKTASAMAKAANDAATAFNNLKIEIMGALAAFGVYTGFKDFLADSTKTNAQLGRLAANLNTSAARLDAWRTTAEEMGDDAGAAFGALQSVATGIAEAVAKGHSAFTDMARANGVQLQDQKGQWLDYEQTLMNISRRLHAVADHNGPLGRQQAMYLANQLGVGGMFNELMLDPNELQRRLAANEALSHATEAATARAQQLQGQWAQLRARFRGIGEDIYTRISPYLLRIGDDFERFLGKIDFDRLAAGAERFINAVDWAALGNWLARIPDTLADIYKWIVQLDKSTGGWAKNILAIAAAWFVLDAALAASPVGLVLMLAAAIVALYNDYKVWQQGGKSFIDWGKWKTEIGYAKDAVDALAASLRGLDKAYEGVKGWLGKNAAQSAADIEAGTDPGHGNSRGSAIHNFFKNMAYWAGYDPATGKKIDASNLLDADDATRQGIKYDVGKDATYNDLEKQYGLPAGIMSKIKQAESGGDANALSSKGALGAFQMLPSTAADYGGTEADLRDPAKASVLAAHYLSDMIKKYKGDVQLGLAAYNAGPGAVDKAGGVPNFAETQAYVAKLGYATDPRQRVGAGQPGATTHNNGSTYNIDKVEIHTQATDAQGIMNDMQRRLPNNGLVSYSNTGTE